VLAAAFLGGVVPSTVLLMVRAVTGRGATNDVELDQRSPLTQLDEIDVATTTARWATGPAGLRALHAMRCNQSGRSDMDPACAGTCLGTVRQQIVRPHTCPGEP